MDSINNHSAHWEMRALSVVTRWAAIHIFLRLSIKNVCLGYYTRSLHHTIKNVTDMTSNDTAAIRDVKAGQKLSC